MYHRFGFLDDGSIVPPYQIVLTPFDSSDSLWILKDNHIPLLLTYLEQENKRKETRQEYLLEENNEYISRIKTI